ncbi:MAG: hypothetical protein WC757_03240 [Candidatus Paceibacterota bacterium]|jgi:hypothetical protein
MARKIHTILLQSCPRQDSLCALFLLRREGEKKYPGISTAKIAFWTTGTISPDGRTWKDYLNEGIFPIGVCGSPWDEHTSLEFGDRKAEGKSTTSLVAEELGISDHPHYRELVKAVTAADLNKVSGLDMSSIIKNAYRDPEADWEKIYRWLETGLKWFINNQIRLQEAFRELKSKNAAIRRNNCGGEVVAIMSDNPSICLAASLLRFAACVQIRSNGQVLIAANGRTDISLEKTVVAIRFEELVAQGREKEAQKSTDSLSVTGQMPLVPNWCYQMPGDMLLNGSETAPGLEPTRIPALKILQTVCETTIRVNKKNPVAT